MSHNESVLIFLIYRTNTTQTQQKVAESPPYCGAELIDVADVPDVDGTVQEDVEVDVEDVFRVPLNPFFFGLPLLLLAVGCC